MKHSKFKKGFTFRKFEGSPGTEIEKFGMPNVVLVPLHHGFGSEVKPIVNIGDLVQKGQMIGECEQTISTPVHASISGRVTEIKHVHENHHRVMAIKIVAEGKNNLLHLEGSRPDWEQLNSQELQSILYNGGVTGLDRCGIPTIHNSSIIVPSDVEEIIINGIDADIFNQNHNIFFDDDGMKINEALQILKKIFTESKMTYVINEDEQKIEQLLNNCKVIREKAVYPKNYDEVIVPIVTGKPFPKGYLSANIGVIVLSPQTLIHIYEAVVEGKPVIERMITLGGKPWRENVNVLTPIGTSIESLIEKYVGDERARIITNSLLTGKVITHSDQPIDKHITCLIAVKENDERTPMAFTRPGGKFHSYTKTFTASLKPKTEVTCDTNVKGEHRPCINCGYCQEVCPAHLLPFILQRYVDSDIINENLVRYGIFDCIGCNLCNYVCPSKIDLAGTIREGEEKLMEEEYTRDLYIPQKFDLKGLEDFRALKGIKKI